MDPLEDYYYLGKIIRLHGYSGSVSAYFDTDEPGEYGELKMVFLKINNMPVPFFIESISMLNNKALIQFEDIHTIEQAERLVQKEIYLPLSELPELMGKKFYYHEIKGFKVIDEQYGEIGKLNQVLEYPNQALMQVMHKDTEVLIPVSDDIIQKVDRKKQEIHVKAPEGLIEIYLGEKGVKS
ncbi:MAG: 16S rRNA processing protein RimM [Chlorobi bacterium]|nr:16S rRNA processing protein RimM [Chlorobiota bacterium]